MKKFNKLNNSTDLKKFIQYGNQTIPFLDSEIVKEQVMCDFNYKTRQGKSANILDSLILWINHEIKYAEKKVKFIQKNQFARTSKEIFESKITSGCTDYALVFATFARQLGYPTTILDTAEFGWCNKLQSNQDYLFHYGHTFCECYFNNEWVLVDPTCNKISIDYNPSFIQLDYSINDSKDFVSFFRGIDYTDSPMLNLESHNNYMDQSCKEMNLTKLNNK